MKFEVILADPPWRNSRSYAVKLGGHSGDVYADLSTGDLCSLSVENLAAADAYLFLWVDAQHPHVAPEVARAWGFPQFATKLTWLKTSPKSGRPCAGIGRYVMTWAEDCWVFKRGKPPFVGTPVQNPFYACRTAHSRKPDWLYEFIESEHTKGKNPKISRFPEPRLELFARTHNGPDRLWEPRPGWTQIGNEFDGPMGLGEDIRDAIDRISKE